MWISFDRVCFIIKLLFDKHFTRKNRGGVDRGGEKVVAVEDENDLGTCQSEWILTRSRAEMQQPAFVSNVITAQVLSTLVQNSGSFHSRNQS